MAWQPSTMQDLLDLEAIRQLKYRYFRAVDTKDFDAVADCFAHDATASYPQRECGSLAEILAFLSESMTPDLVTMHQGHHPEIVVEADTARGTWTLHDQVYLPALDFALEGAAVYSDTYRREARGWVITHTGYQRLFEKTWSLADPPGAEVPGYRVKQGELSRGQA